MDPILSLKDVKKHYEGLKAVDGVSFDVYPHRITGLIGPNGAGKTTVFNLISGTRKLTSGSITFDGQDIGDLPLHRTYAMGLCRTFQISRELKLMTVLENLMLVPLQQDGENLFLTWFAPRKVRKQESQNRERAQEILRTVGLDQLQNEYAGSLSGGQKRLLELARTMMAKPRLILFDEPGAGVNPTERRTLAERIRHVVDDQGITVLLIGHEMELVMDICDPIVVMDQGRKLTEGTPEEVGNDPKVLEVYLGGSAT